jgi:hypothetical protein
MAAGIVNINTQSDADYVKAFMVHVNNDAGADYYFNFAGVTMEMMVRKQATDAEVYVELSTDSGDGIALSASNSSTPDYLDTINITIKMEQLSKMPAGDYVHSLIMTRADGAHDDIWRGTLTHAIGPTR